MEELLGEIAAPGEAYPPAPCIKSSQGVSRVFQGYEVCHKLAAPHTEPPLLSTAAHRACCIRVHRRSVAAVQPVPAQPDVSPDKGCRLA